MKYILDEITIFCPECDVVIVCVQSVMLSLL